MSPEFVNRAVDRLRDARAVSVLASAVMLGSYLVGHYEDPQFCEDPSAEPVLDMRGEEFAPLQLPYDFYETIEVIEKNEDDSMAGFADTYLSAIVPRGSSEGVEITIDESITQYSELSKSYRNRVNLAFDVSTLYGALKRFPAGFFDQSGVRIVNLADTYTSYIGHYDTSTNTLQIEHDPNRLFNDETLYPLLWHETGHALHFILCGQDARKDGGIGSFNTMPYIGRLEDGLDQKKVNAHYAQVPAVLYKFGPNREFIDAYSAVSAAEDFADIVEYTLTKRGIIQPNDEDAASPLAVKQQFVLNRIEAIMPGFRDFAATISKKLRLHPTNEMYGTKPTVIPISRKALQAAVLSNTSQSPLVFNGFYAFDDVVYPDVSVQPYPKIVRTGDDVSIIRANSEVRFSAISLTRQEDLHESMDLLVPVNEAGEFSGPLIKPLGSIEEVSRYGIPTQNILNTKNAADWKKLKPLADLDYRRVTVTFTD